MGSFGEQLGEYYGDILYIYITYSMGIIVRNVCKYTVYFTQAYFGGKNNRTFPAKQHLPK